MTPELTFKRYRKYDTDECPSLNLAGMQLAIINDPYFIFLSDETTSKLHKICEECISFEPTWLAIDKHS